MDSNFQPQTDLASILQTLRAYAPSQQPTPPLPQVFQTNEQLQIPPQAPELEEGEYDPSAYDPSLPLITTPHPQAPHPHPQPQHTLTTTPIRQDLNPPTTHHPAQPPESTAPTNPSSHTPVHKKNYTQPTYHPSTITTWPPALRHITTLTTSNPTFVQRIRHLITTQHTHERQWWTGRTTLEKTLANRSEGRKKLDSVLGSLGGHVEVSSKSDELTAEQELKMYDKKVHRACRDMVAATGKELRKLEVPFFCVLEGLVSEKGDGGKAEGKRKGTISEGELVELRGRMMALLEDLCGEE